MIRLGLDLDGVIFDFTTHFVNLVKKRYPQVVTPPVSSEWPTKWGYIEDYLEQWEERALWRYICGQSTDFWATCPVYPHSTSLIDCAHEYADLLYFITSRQGPDVQWQTVQALRNLAPHDAHYGGVIPTPNAEAKIPIIKALNLTHYVDDKIETVETVYKECPAVHIAVWDQPWNRHATWLPNRLKSVDDFRMWMHGRNINDHV